MHLAQCVRIGVQQVSPLREDPIRLAGKVIERRRELQPHLRRREQSG